MHMRPKDTTGAHEKKAKAALSVPAERITAKFPLLRKLRAWHGGVLPLAKLRSNPQSGLRPRRFSLCAPVQGTGAYAYPLSGDVGFATIRQFDFVRTLARAGVVLWQRKGARHFPVRGPRVVMLPVMDIFRFFRYYIIDKHVLKNPKGFFNRL
jgi:hypothetical protein